MLITRSSPPFSAELVTIALKDTPVVMVTGPRQCGKTTLVRDLVSGKREFITMDDDTVLAVFWLSVKWRRDVLR
jgi:predicted AAA+ superfamily ATPase